MVNIIATYSHPKYTNGKEIEKIYKAYREKMHDQNLPVEISGVLNELGIWATTWDKYINFNPDDDLCITDKEKQGYIDTASKALEANSYEAKRETAGDAAITRQRLNEAFAANGLNTGAVGQANLALLNQKAENLNKIDLTKQQAQQEYDAQKAALMQSYQAEVKSAIQQNDADKAKALYAAWKEQQAQAQALAVAQTKAAGSGSGSSRRTADDEKEDDSKDKDGTANYKNLLSKAIEESKSPMITSSTTKQKTPMISTPKQVSDYQNKAMSTIQAAKEKGLITSQEAAELMIQAMTPKRY